MRPLLALALVRRQHEFATIAHLEALVPIEYGLDKIVAVRQGGEVRCRPSERGVVDYQRSVRCQRTDVDPEDIRTGERLIRLNMRAWLAAQIAA